MQRRRPATAPRSPRRSTALERELADLASALSNPGDRTSREPLLAALVSPRATVVALAAQAVREAALPGVEEALVRTYASLHGEDPGCRARLALLEALDHLEATDDAPFVHAARYVQMEKAWGAPVDTAAGVRARAVAGLARMGSRDLSLVLGEMLADPEPPVQAAAADALAHFRGERATSALLEVVARGRRTDATAAVKALASRAFEPDLARRAREAGEGNRELDVADLVAREFGDARG